MSLRIKPRAVIGPVGFAKRLIDPETGQPFVLYPAQRRFLTEAFKPGMDGRLT